MEPQQHWVYERIPRTEQGWSRASHGQGLDDVHIRSTVRRLAGLDAPLALEPQTSAFSNFLSYIMVACCYVRGKTGENDSAVALMRLGFPEIQSEAILTDYQQTVAETIKWMVGQCSQIVGPRVFEGMFHAEICVPNLIQVEKHVLQELFMTMPWTDMCQSSIFVPLYIPFLVHHHLPLLSLKTTCDALGVPTCQAEYDEWARWLAGGSIPVDPVLSNVHQLQTVEESNMGHDALRHIANDSMEYLNEGNWEIPDSPSQILSTSANCLEERPRDWPGGTAFFWGNAIEINLNAMESLRALEYHVLTPLTAFSISQSYLAHTQAPIQVVDGPERHYRWLRHYKELAYHTSEDLVERHIIRPALIHRLPVTLSRNGNVVVGSTTAKGWIQVLARITRERGSCMITLNRRYDDGQVSVLNQVLWATDQVLILDEGVSFVPAEAIDYIAVLIRKPNCLAHI